jgi:hypothetical protein
VLQRTTFESLLGELHGGRSNETGLAKLFFIYSERLGTRPRMTWNPRQSSSCPVVSHRLSWKHAGVDRNCAHNERKSESRKEWLLLF